MDFDFSEDQRTIKATARDLLASRSAFERVRAAAESGSYDRRSGARWASSAGPASRSPRSTAGSGSERSSWRCSVEELGIRRGRDVAARERARGADDREAGDAEQRARWLPGLVSGSDRRVRRRRRALRRRRPRVVIVVVDGRATPRAGRGRRRRGGAGDAIDPTSRYGRVRGNGKPIGGAAGRAPTARPGAVAAELAGLCQRALDETVAFVKERKQFGAPSGRSRPSRIAAPRCC